MPPTPAELRHGIRGTLNALKLCVSAFEMPLETSEKLEFLSDIEASADKLSTLLDEYEPQAPQTPPPPGIAAAAVVDVSVGASRGAGHTR